MNTNLIDELILVANGIPLRANTFDEIIKGIRSLESEIKRLSAENNSLAQKYEARELELDACWRVLAAEMGINAASSAVAHVADEIEREIK